MGVRSRTGKSTKAAAKLKATTKKEIPEPIQPDKTLWQKTFNRDADLSPEDALMAVHWMRQVTGLLAGMIFGLLQLTGFPAILMFFVISFVGPSTLLSTVHELDIEEISKAGSLQTEGSMPSFALFILSWIISYTVFLPPST